MLIQRIELKKPVGKFKAGDKINATIAAVEAAGLKPGDYIAIGSHPHPVPLDLPQPAAKPAEAKQ